MILLRHNFFFLTRFSFSCSTAESCLPSKPRLLSPPWSMGMTPWVRSTCLGRKRRVPRPMAHHSCPCTVSSMEKPTPMKCSRSAVYRQRATGTVWCQPSSAWWDMSTYYIQAQKKKSNWSHGDAGSPLIPDELLSVNDTVYFIKSICKTKHFKSKDSSTLK